MSSDTRRYEHRQWDALLSTDLGVVASPDRFLAARQAAGTVLVEAAGAGIHNLIAQVHVSFFGTPSGTSTLTIQHGGTTTFQSYLTAGNNTFTFTPPHLAPPNTPVQVIVSPGGGTAITNVLAGTIVPYPYRVQ